VIEGARIDTSTPGVHSFTVIAKDGAGNATSMTRTYRVGLAHAKYQPDVLIKRYVGGSFVCGNVYGTASRQHVTESIAAVGGSARALVRVQNDGNRDDRMTIHAPAGTSTFHVAYYLGNRNITAQVTAGTYRTASLSPGRFVTLRIKVTRTAAARPGQETIVRLTAVSGKDAAKHDVVAAIIHAIR